MAWWGWRRNMRRHSNSLRRNCCRPSLVIRRANRGISLCLRLMRMMAPLAWRIVGQTVDYSLSHPAVSVKRGKKRSNPCVSASQGLPRRSVAGGAIDLPQKRVRSFELRKPFRAEYVFALRNSLLATRHNVDRAASDAPTVSSESSGCDCEAQKEAASFEWGRLFICFAPYSPIWLKSRTAPRSALVVSAA